MFVTCRGEPHDVFGGSSAGRRSSNRKILLMSLLWCDSFKKKKMFYCCNISGGGHHPIVPQREGVRGRHGVASLRALSSTTSAHYVTEDVAAKPSVRMLGLCFRTDKCYRSSATRQKIFFWHSPQPQLSSSRGDIASSFRWSPDTNPVHYVKIQSIKARFYVH